MTSDFPFGGERSDGPPDTGEEDAFARLEMEMATMRDAIGGLSDQISDAASDISAVAQDQAGRGMNMRARIWVDGMTPPIGSGLSPTGRNPRPLRLATRSRTPYGNARWPLSLLGLASWPA